MSFLYPAGRALARFCFHTFGRLEVTGKENVPPYGPLLVVANHMSFNDPPMLVASLPRPLTFIGKEELFYNPIMGNILRAFNTYPLRHASSGLEAMRLSLDLLAQDRAVVLFPEGRRSPNHALMQGLPGAAYLALKSQAPILPVGIAGTEKFPAWRMPFPLSRVRVSIGQPFTPPVVEGRLTKEVQTSVVNMMMQRIAAQLPPQYRGEYPLSGPTDRDGESAPSR